ncbi:hypothetical protein GPZ88_00795 [Streptococcus ruminicola]|uniref:YopX protein domain-containing protein n=1 Tax=Streptococcus ruminicola TaxID=2686210 RepID=A0A6G8HY23_9STRE|nr:YopX family protein [Streptococcus ruminicola]QIM45678.1 hypothetical protein GPZ88_00795 [Streptococcus ruminicola]
MRVPKFRTWVKDEKRMLPVGDLDSSYKTTYLEESNGYRCERFFDEIELMEFTGLKDKNGVEICEGDIVKHKYICDGTFYTEAVIYDKNYASFGLKAKHGTIFYFVELNNDGLSSLEVIGNIWENKDLLGE